MLTEVLKNKRKCKMKYLRSVKKIGEPMFLTDESVMWRM